MTKASENVYPPGTYIFMEAEIYKTGIKYGTEPVVLSAIYIQRKTEAEKGV